MQTALAEAIKAYTDQHVGDEGFFRTEIEAMLLIRSDKETAPRHALYRPALCINVQGSKHLFLEDQVVDYGEMQYLVMSLSLPAISQMRPNSLTLPFLAVALELDFDLLRDTLHKMGVAPPESKKPHLALFVGNVAGRVAECILRIVRLLDTPEAIPILYPLLARELYYWLLVGPDGAAIARLARLADGAGYVGNAIRSIRNEITKPVRIEELARIANMSPSSFHSQFKAATSMTPIQFQKRLRLLEARRLMTSGLTNATQAGYRVGYGSASQFSREYARMFGAPPRRDIKTIQSALS